MFSIKSRKHDSIIEKYRYSLYYSYARPSFIEGLARIFDLGGTLRNDYKPCRTVYEQDIAAMRNDWIVIGQDIGDAICAYADREKS